MNSVQYFTSGGVYVGRYIRSNEVDNWPSGSGHDDYKRIVDTAEDLLERATQAHFYEKPFDIRVNGNAKNRITLPLRSNIISVSSVKVWGSVLDPNIYFFDKSSLCINYEVGIGGYPELLYMLSEFNRYAMFPRGLGNVHVVGTYGNAEFATLAARAALLLARDVNDPSLYLHYLESETVGKYSYRTTKEFSDAVGLTGIKEVDDILKLIRRGKTLIMAP
jgi:hypothetical protein